MATIHSLIYSVTNEPKPEPPKSREDHDRARRHELSEAIKRYILADQLVHAKWLNELNELMLKDKIQAIKF